MKQFGAFVKKEFFHILRDPRTVMLLLIMPVIQIILFGFALTNEVKNVNIAVFNSDLSIESRIITERLSAGENFQIKKYLHSHTEIPEVIERGEVKLVIVFNKGFGSDLRHTGKASVNVIADASEPNLAQSALMYATNIIRASSQEFLKGGEISSAPRVEPSLRLLYNPQLKSAYNFVPGVMGMILMLICAMMTSISIVREKETGTMELLLASPVKPFGIIIAKTIPYFVISVINIATILVLSIYLLNVPVSGSLFWLLFISFLFVLVSLSVGMLISTLVDSQVAAMLISGMVFMMPVILLSGMIYPVENMPKILQVIAQIIPAKWFIAGARKLMIQGVDVVYALREIAVLTFMLVLFFGLTIKNFKYRLD